MRIGLNNSPDPQPVSAEQTTKSSTSAANQSASAPAGDKSALSQDRVTLSVLASQALSTPEVRQPLIDRLKQGIQSGQYQIDPRAIAESMLS